MPIGRKRGCSGSIHGADDGSAGDLQPPRALLDALEAGERPPVLIARPDDAFQPIAEAVRQFLHQDDLRVETVMLATEMHPLPIRIGDRPLQ
jgi:hypothetical protein